MWSGGKEGTLVSMRSTSTLTHFSAASVSLIAARRHTPSSDPGFLLEATIMLGHRAACGTTNMHAEPSAILRLQTDMQEQQKTVLGECWRWLWASVGGGGRRADRIGLCSGPPCTQTRRRSLSRTP